MTWITICTFLANKNTKSLVSIGLCRKRQGLKNAPNLIVINIWLYGRISAKQWERETYR